MAFHSANRTFPPLAEVFLVLDQPRQRLTHWVSSLAAIGAPNSPQLVSVDAYYHAAEDRAYLALRYDERALGSERLSFLTEVARLAEIKVFEPARWPEVERRRFYADRIECCRLSVDARKSVPDALGELVRRVRNTRAEPRPQLGARPGEVPLLNPPRATGQPSRAITDPEERAPTLNAQASRRNSDGIDILIDELNDEVSRPVIELGLAQLRQVPRASAQLPLVDRSLQLLEHDERTFFDDVITATGDGEVAAASNVSASSSKAVAPTMIAARFLRSGRWLPTRLGALSLRGCFLLTGAVARLGDVVHVAISFGEHVVVVRGVAKHLATGNETQNVGAAGFALEFDLDAVSTPPLTTLLKAARAAKVTITPPPPRAERRYPVSWPIALAGPQGPIRAEATDISRRGMFIATARPLEMAGSLAFSAILDEQDTPIQGKLRVVRQTRELDAKVRNLQAGYGSLVESFDGPDEQRWHAFLGRVRRRSERRILVGAAHARLAEVTQALCASGYAVTSGADASAFMQLADAERRAVDAVVLDASWDHGGMPPGWAESLFASRSVPFATLHGAPSKARLMADQMLGILG